MYCGTAEQVKALKTYAAQRREAVTLYPAVKKVIQEFDGKCFNCRFKKALEAADSRLHCEKRFTWLIVYTYAKNTYDQIDLASINEDDMKDGKRINAEKLIESANTRRAALLKEATDVERTAAQVDDIKAQIKNLNDTYNAIVDGLPSHAQSVLDLHHRYR